MNIGFFLVPYQRFSGAGEYYHNLFRELIKIDTENTYTIFLPHDVDREVKKFFGTDRCVDTGLPSRPGSKRVALTLINNCVQRHIPQIDLLHCFNVPLPRFKGIILLTTYDSREEDWPETFPPLHSFFTNILKPSAFKRVNQIITISDFSKQRILYHYPFCRDKVERIYLGSNKVDNIEHERLHPRSYLLAIGQIAKHKNLETLIAAFNLCAKNPEFKHDLIIIGHHYGKDSYMEKLKNMVDIKCKNRVIFTGRVSNEQTAAYYAHAALFIFPSLYEGFGIPIVEASQYLVPVIASRIPVFEEIYGIPEAMFDPASPQDCAQTIVRVLTDVGLQARMKQESNLIVKKYNSKATAEQTLDLYKKVFNQA